MATVLGDAFAFGVHDAQVDLGFRVSLFRGLADPRHRLAVVLRDAHAVGVHVPQLGLGIRVPLFGQRPENAQGRDVVALFVGFHPGGEIHGRRRRGRKEHD